jgi:hypothetical protein
MVDDQIGREVTDVVTTNAVGNKANFLDVIACRDRKRGCVPKQNMKIRMKGAGKINPEARAAIAGKRKAQPVLLYLREAVPKPQQCIVNWPALCSISQKL